MNFECIFDTLEPCQYDVGVPDIIQVDYSKFDEDYGLEFIEYDTITETNEETEPYIKQYYLHRNDFTNEIQLEPVLSTLSERYTIFPVQYPTIWNLYKKQQEVHWIPQEVDLSQDIKHWNTKLSKNDRKFIVHVLAFFASFDGIVNVNIKENIIDVVKIKEGECAYGKQFDMENTHAEMYALMLDTFVTDVRIRNKLINSIRTMSSIKKKAIWCKKWIESDKTYAHKKIAFAIIEGVFFSGSFASIFWLKTRPGSIMPGLRKSNKFIARDENLHVELACAMYQLLNNKLKESVIYEIIEEAIIIEDEFINESLPCKLLGMNADLMSQYIKYCADRLLVQLGYNKKYNVENPFEYMKKIDSYCKENFFEGRSDEYSDAKINNLRSFEILNDDF